MRKGFTLAELLITVVILGILAAITLPNFTSSVDKARANQAVAFLRVIRTGEQMFFARNGRYWACAAAACTVAELTANLGADIAGSGYAFSVVTPAATTFTASARAGGVVPAGCAPANTDTICLNQVGAWSGGSIYLPTA